MSDDAYSERMKDYEVYRSDETDITYTQNFYNLENYSLTLLKSKKPLDQEKYLGQRKRT